MLTYEVMPGQLVTDQVYEHVLAVLASEAPGVADTLTWERFTRPAGGVFAIPDRDGQISKVELILADSPELTVKLNRWYLPDLRAGARPAPHNHRWRTMRSRIIAGGYRDHVYRSSAAGVDDELRTHQPGTDNVIEHHEFHEVTDVEPGTTWTVFVGDASQPGDWGYLDPDTGRYTHSAAISPDPAFAANFRRLNPHTR